MNPTMKAVIIQEHGGVEKLKYVEAHPVPGIGAGEVQVNVKAVALNRLDLWVREGWPGLKLQFPHVLGSDAAGIITKIGEGVRNVKIGDEVLLAPGWGCGDCQFCLEGKDNLCQHYKILGQNTQGVYAEFVKAPAANALPIPLGLSFEEAAAIPLVFLTAWHMLVDQVNLQPGEDILIHAGGSGVGSAAIQIAKLLGARVFTTASSQPKLDKAAELGADICFNYTESDFFEEVMKQTNKCGVDVVFEHVGESTWEKSIKSLRKGGRLVTCGATTGHQAVTDLRYVFFKELKILGNFMGPKAGLASALKFFPEKLKPVVDKVFDLKDAAKAHDYLNNREQFGKVILKV